MIELQILLVILLVVYLVLVVRWFKVQREIDDIIYSFNEYMKTQGKRFDDVHRVLHK